MLEPLQWLIGLDFSFLRDWSIFVPVGTAIGLIVAYFASREYIRQTIKTLKDTIASQEQSLKAKDDLAKSLSETHISVIASLEEKLKAMTDERDNYRKQLHDIREEITPLKLEIQELKLRPDLNVVIQKEEAWHSRREVFYTDMAANQRAIIETSRDTLRIIGEIKTSVEQEIKESNEVCAAVGKGLQDVLSGMIDRDHILIEIRDLLRKPSTESAI